MILTPMSKLKNNCARNSLSSCPNELLKCHNTKRIFDRRNEGHSSNKNPYSEPIEQRSHISMSNSSNANNASTGPPPLHSSLVR